MGERVYLLVKNYEAAQNPGTKQVRGKKLLSSTFGQIFTHRFRSHTVLSHRNKTVVLTKSTLISQQNSCPCNAVP